MVSFNNEENMGFRFSKFKELQGDTLVSLAMLLFGGYSLFLKLFPQIPVLTFLLAFQVVGAIAFLPMAVRQGMQKLAKADWLLLLALAVSAILNDMFYFFAFRLTTVANAAISHQMVSVFLLFLAPWLLKEKTRKNEWGALSVALLGIVVLYGRQGIDFRNTTDFLGITFGLFSALFYALIVILYRYIPEKRRLSISTINLWRFVASTILLLPFMAKFGGFAVTAHDLFPLAGFGVLFAFVASGIHNFGMSKARSLHSSIIGKSEPAIAIVYAFFFLRQIPSIEAIVGGILIVGSSIWLIFKEETEEKITVAA